MDLKPSKNWIRALLFFSIALNIGFISITIDRKVRHGFHPPPGMPMLHGPEQDMLIILSRMPLSPEIKEKADACVRDMWAHRLQSFRRMIREEKKVIDLMGRPGDLDMELIETLIASQSRAAAQRIEKKAEHLVNLRNLLGQENSLFLISEMKKIFEERMPRGRMPD